MKMMTSGEKLTPTYYSKLASKNRNAYPVDFTCTRLNCCKKHPVDILFGEMEEAAKNGATMYELTISKLMRNIETDLVPRTITENIKNTSGKLWWKKEEVTSVTKANPEYIHFCAKLAWDTLDELGLILFNKGFHCESTHLNRDMADDFQLPISATRSLLIYF